MKDDPLFILPTFNEEARVGTIVSYYQKLGTVLVIDNYSQDQTANIARANGATVILKKNNGTAQTPEYCRWLKLQAGEVPIITLSCSEFLSEATIKAIHSELLNHRVGVVELMVRSFTDGVELPLWGNKKRYVERGLHLGKIDISGIRIHAPFRVKDGSSFIKVTLPEKFYVEHLRVTKFSDELIKMTHYAKIEAQQKIEDGIVYPLRSFLKLLLRECINFLIPRNLRYIKISFPQILLRIIMHYVIYRCVNEDNVKAQVKYKEKYR